MDSNATLAAIAGIVIIECVALACGIDGTVLITSTAAIAGLGGYSVAKLSSPPPISEGGTISAAH